ncbi:GntR family transcriptional regulator [Clostridium fermenticellae]|uniref:GntR family transcriptional regulator n=1 Tax=Clostridium fermenticellae TaxID=2068654 RepID=A0A386H3G3_9CLOT|nr:GntR family transcriptional regulator [Clostridium fermenticellae]AYD40220.1 GntR family transcriptional regulator [Clostridium fermenticellae]
MDYISNNSQPATVEQVYHDIRHRILKLELEPGQKISENQMCKEYNTSRFVIRNVYNRLSQLGLITIYPQRGTYVSLIDINYIDDLMFLRSAVEKEVLNEIFTNIKESNRLALVEKLEKNLELQEYWKGQKSYNKDFMRLDSEFHKLIIDSVNRYRLVRILSDPMLHIARWRNFDVSIITHRLPELIEEHREIVNAIKDSDLDRAKQGISNHLSSISTLADLAKEEYPQYFTDNEPGFI